MITANQGAILRATNRLHEARNALLDMPSLICINDDQRARIHNLISEIDSLFKEFISGELPPKARKKR